MTGGALPLRRVRFRYPDDLDPDWIPARPEVAAAANAVSALMPAIEPYFARSVRAVLPMLDEPLRTRTDAYVRQELRHQAEHRRFNELLRRRSPRIGRVESLAERCFRRLTRTRSTRFNVAFAAAAETIAFALARWTERHLGDVFDDADPLVRTLFLWHLAEEVEHKSAAYDVFEAVDGSRMRYTGAAVTAAVVIAVLVWLGTLALVAGGGRLLHPLTHLRLARWATSAAFTVLPVLAASCLPGHHPTDLADPVYLPAWLRQYDPATGTIPVWETPPG